MELVLSNTLLYGVLASTGVIMLGLIILAARGQLAMPVIVPAMH